MADQQHTQLRVPVGAVLDIEHTVVEDDPRTWSRTRKVRSSSSSASPRLLIGRLAAQHRRDRLRGEYDHWPWREHIQS